MGEFHKIYINETESKQTVPPKKKKGNKKFVKILSGLVLFLLITAVFLFFAVFLPAKDLYSQVTDTSKIALEAYSSLKNQDLEQTQIKIKETKAKLQKVKEKLDPLLWLKNIPFAGVYVADGQRLLTSAIAGVEAGEITIDTLIPYSDLLGFKGKSTFVSGSADDRIKTAVETLDKVTPKLSEISSKIEIIGKELDQIDPERYPLKLGEQEIKSKIIMGKDIFSQTAKLFIEAQPLLAKLPELLGNKTPKTYLFLFQNNAELRATGGFITAYALFSVDKGKMKVIKADDIYKLDESKTKKFPAPAPITKYHKTVYNWELRDSNLSPDFADSMKQLGDMIKESVPGFPSYDGIFSFDLHVLVSAIKILGDFNIYGRNFSAANDPRCDCPKVIYELEDYSTKPVAYVREDRKDIIGVFMYQLMQRALGVSPSKYWGNLFQMFLAEAKEKHIIFNFKDADAQKGIEAVNFGGRLNPYDGDYIHISDVNFAGAKSNLFVTSSIKQEIGVEGDGTVTKTLTISYKNPAAASNCNLEAGQLCLNGILRNWLRIYVPLGSKLIDFKGSEMNTQVYDESGKTVIEGFLTVKPQGASEVKVKYSIPYKPKGMYKMLIQKQPGTDKFPHEIVYKGKGIENFPLLTDKEVTFKL